MDWLSETFNERFWIKANTLSVGKFSTGLSKFTSITNRTPSELFLKRKLCTRMDLLRPDNQAQTRLSEKQGSQKLDHDRRSTQREYRVGETVIARKYRDGPKWMEGIVVERKGPLSYVVQVNHGMLWRRHIDHLRNGPSTAQQTVTWRFPLVLSQKRGRANTGNREWWP